MQRNTRSTYLRLAGTGLATVVMAMLAGCGVNGSTPTTNYTTPVTLQGQVFAGRNYMPGAIVKIYATQPSGTASNGSYTGTAKLLTTLTANTVGTWSVQNLTCTSPDQLYVTAEGGAPFSSASLLPTLPNNPNSLMMTAIGDCSILTSAGGNNNTTSIVTNEASTVAAVYALRNFISLNGTTVNVTSSATNYAGTSGAGTPTSFAGLAHAFLNANALSPFKAGNFVQYTNGSPDGTTGGLVPVHELNSLAYSMYLCTIGGTTVGDFSYCATLYQLATPPGGTAPANSLAAMLNIARFPKNNVAGIMTFSLTPIPYTAQTGSQQINAGVYVPALSGLGTGTGSATDWSVAIYYLPPYGQTASGQGTAYPQFLTLDANDDVFISNATGSTSTAGNVIAINSIGNVLWTTPTDTTGLIQPRAIAADALGHVWVTNGTATAGSGLVEEINATSGAIVATYPSTAATLYGLAVDSLGNVWYDSNSTTGQNLHELVRSGSTYSEAAFAVPPMSPAYQLLQIRPDSKNNIWVSGMTSTTAAAVYLPNTGTAAAPTYTTGLFFSPLTGNSTYGITTDAAGNAYSVSDGTGNGIFKTTATGTGTSTTLASTNLLASPAAASRDLETDGLGNIWYLDNTTGTYLYQYMPASNTLTSFYPCYNAGTLAGGTAPVCSTGLSTKQSLAVDSTGTMWVASYGNSGGGRIAQIIGLAAPTVPLRSLGKPGVMP